MREDFVGVLVDLMVRWADLLPACRRLEPQFLVRFPFAVQTNGLNLSTIVSLLSKHPKLGKILLLNLQARYHMSGFNGVLTTDEVFTVIDTLLE